jgi:hypothetical protein
MSDIPHQVSDITVAWLNDVLATSHDPHVGTVESLTIERFGEGVGILGELARLVPQYADGHDGPVTMIAKCQSPAPENQFLSEMMGFYLREVNFYREVAEQLDIRVPHAYFVDASPTGLPFVLLLEDISGARCPDQITGLTAGEAASILDVVAGLHARYWDSTELDGMAWLPPMNNALYKAGQAMAMAKWPAFEERFADRLGAEMIATVRRTCESYPEMLDHMVAQGHATLTHTDCRAENYLFGGSAGADAITMIDFQLSTRHLGAWDVAYLLSGSLSVDDRRAHEHQLVAGYHARLVELGVPDYSLDQCWRDVRLSLLQLCAATVIISDLQGGNERGEELLESLLLRPLLAARDHHVGDLLDEFC